MLGRMTCPLRDALSYTNRDVIFGFVDRFGVSDKEGRVIFRDMQRWLWLNSLPGRPALAMTPEILIIDEMWHTFVLFTKAYARYCQTRFGCFLHHLPASRREKARRERERLASPAHAWQSAKRTREAQYRFIAERLGRKTLLRWYAEYPLRYDRAFFQRFGIQSFPLGAAVVAHLTKLLPGPALPNDHEARVIVLGSTTAEA
jgi:hypothetical protein